MADLLFYGPGHLRDMLEAQAVKMHEAVEAEPESSLMQADEEAWADALAHHYAADCPVLKTDSVWQEPPKDTTIDVSGDRMRAIFDPYSDAVRNFPAYRIVVHIPFEGDARVFRLRPGQFSLSPPRCQVGKDELRLAITFPQDAPRPVDPEAQSFIDNVQTHLGWARAQGC